MTDPNDTPALDLDAVERRARFAVGFCVKGGIDPIRASLTDVPALVARIAVLEAERDACERARSDHAERVVELNKTCNYLERTALDAAQRVETAEAERDAALARVREWERAMSDLRLAAGVSVLDADAPLSPDDFAAALLKENQRCVDNWHRVYGERETAERRVRELEAAAQTVAEERERCARVADTVQRERAPHGVHVGNHCECEATERGSCSDCQPSLAQAVARAIRSGREP